MKNANGNGAVRKKPATGRKKTSAVLAQRTKLLAVKELAEQLRNLKKSIEIADITSLTPHPRNYRDHPEDQIAHLMQSIQQHGFYRNIVVARDKTILAGHGLVKAATKLGIHQVPILRLDIDSTDSRALQILVGDNEIAHLALANDRELTEILKTLFTENPDQLFGTGYDQNMLAALAMVTRNSDEIRDKNEAAQWLGMPVYIDEDHMDVIKITVYFASLKERARFAKILGVELPKDPKEKLSMWWPPNTKVSSEASDIEFVAKGKATPAAARASK